MLQSTILAPDRLYARFVNWNGVYFPEMTLKEIKALVQIAIDFNKGLINNYSVVEFKKENWIVAHLFDEYKIATCADVIEKEFSNN